MSVKVAVRSRPLNENEVGDNTKIIIRMNNQMVTVVDSPEGSGGSFLFDYALWSSGQRFADSANPEASQALVYAKVGNELLQHVLTGYNGCIFAYGQTGSGKTYCMMGSEENPGLVPRIAENLFAAVQKLSTQHHVETCVEVSYYEIYNEKVRCLLRPSSGGYEESTLRVREHPKYGPFIEGLAKFVVTQQSEFLRLMTDGNTIRTTASTAMNATSSRSHAVFAITLSQKRTRGSLVTTTTSRLNLVDLAGSERASKSLATGKRLVEGANINRSLTCLGNVISALAEVEETGKPRHIPYRDSTLTWILKDNLGGNSKTVMLAAISPSSAQYEETMSTLRYAERAKKIVNKAVINESNNNEVVAALQKEIEALKRQLANASIVERIRLQEELDASEAVKREFDASLEDKLEETRRMMEEREQYMRELELKLNAQESEIESLRNDNAEKEKRIQELLDQVRKLSQGDRRSLDRRHELAVDKILEEVAALEEEQNVQASVTRRRTLYDDRGSGCIGLPGGEAVEADALSVGSTTSAGLQAFHHRSDQRRASRGQHRSSNSMDAVPATTADAGEHGGPRAMEAASPGTDARYTQGEEEIYGDDNLAHGSDDNDDDDDDDEADPDLDLDSLRSFLLDDEDDDIGDDGSNIIIDADRFLDEDVSDDDLIVEEDHVITPDREPLSADKSGSPTSGERCKRAGSQTAPRQQGSPPAKSVHFAHLPLSSEALDPVQATGNASGLFSGRPSPSSLSFSHHEHIRGLSTRQVGAQSMAFPEGRPEIYAPADNVTRLVVPSHALPNNRYLREPFKVVKYTQNSLLNQRKDRIWEIDFFRQRFSNYNMNGQRSFELPARNLYRVERDSKHSRRLTLYFFDCPTTFSLEFSSVSRRQRFYELATLLRRNAVVWCPSLCLEGENDCLITVRGTTIERPHNQQIRVDGEAEFMVARMPYEVIDFWYGCFSLENKPLPSSTGILSGFIPKGVHEVYVVGVTNVPASLIGNDVLGNFFLSYLGSAVYFLLASSTVESKERRANNAMVVLCRRSFIVRVSQLDAREAVPVYRDDVAKGDFTAVGCTFAVNEATFGIFLINAKKGHDEGGCSKSSRTACIRSLLSSFDFGNPDVDIFSRFDYLVVSGQFGYGGDFSPPYLSSSASSASSSCVAEYDVLKEEMEAGNLMTGMLEAEPSAVLRSSSCANAMRVLYSFRQRVSRMDVTLYSLSRALPSPNTFFTADVFCQRSFISIFGEYVPRVQLIFDDIVLGGERLPSRLQAPAVEMIGDYFDNSPLRTPLVPQGKQRFLTSPKSPPVVYPCVSNREFLRLRSVVISITGVLKEGGERTNIASGVLPLKSHFCLGEYSDFRVPLFYRGCPVGVLEGSVLAAYYEANEAEMASLGLGGEKYTSVISCYENQRRAQRGAAWHRTRFPEHGVFPFSSQDPTTEQLREAFELPDTRTWRWRTGWQHDSRPDNKAGWVYSDSFAGPFQLQESKTSFARRRRWIRVMQALDPLSLHDYLAVKEEQLRERML